MPYWYAREGRDWLTCRHTAYPMDQALIYDARMISCCDIQDVVSL